MKRTLSLFLALTLIASCVLSFSIVNAEEAKLPLVLLTKDSTTAGFNTWLEEVERVCNLDITVIASSTNSVDRQAEITTILSTADTSVDIITVNDEMYTAFKNTGWLADLSDIMTPELIKEYPEAYMNDLVIKADGSICSVPGYFSALGWFVNTDIMKELGYEKIATLEDFRNFIKDATNADRFGYGGAWDTAYVFNEIGSFVNLFGGDYFDWTNPKTQAGLTELYNIYKNGYTSSAQMSDKYEQLRQFMIDQKDALCLIYTGNIANFAKANAYGEDGYIQMITPPVFDEEVGPMAYCSSWHFVLNAASKNTEAAKRFLTYAASKEGQLCYAKNLNVFPAYLEMLSDPEMDKVTGIDDMRNYLASVTLRGRPIVAEASEYIDDIGTLFQKLIVGEINLDGFFAGAADATSNYVD